MKCNFLHVKELLRTDFLILPNIPPDFKQVEKLDAIRNPSLRWPLRSSKWPTQNWKYDAGPHGVWCWQGWVLSLAWEWGLVVSVGRPELDLGDDRHSTVTSATLLLRLLLLVRNEPAISIGSLYYQRELPGEALVIIIRMSQIFGTFWNHRFWVLLYDRKVLRPSLGISNCRFPCWPGLQSSISLQSRSLHDQWALEAWKTNLNMPKLDLTSFLSFSRTQKQWVQKSWKFGTPYYTWVHNNSSYLEPLRYQTTSALGLAFDTLQLSSSSSFSWMWMVEAALVPPTGCPSRSSSISRGGTENYNQFQLKHKMKT